MKNLQLLTREEFNRVCRTRDGHRCVNCGATDKLSVHHIIERRLWNDFGYYSDNGATLCDPCHILAEATLLSCEDIRALAGIETTHIPDDYYRDHCYTKWGDVILPDGRRMKGPLFHDESVQKILAHGDVLGLYSDYVKYPRTYHLPWSEGRTKDDRTLENTDHFAGKEIVITTKMDGENTSIYSDYVHARSIDGRNHWSRSRVKNLQAEIGFQLDPGWRICGENLQAKHSIKYDNLEAYFLVFSIWNEQNVCLSWDETVEYATILGLKTVPVLYRGVFDEKMVRSLYSTMDRNKDEGYVVRIADYFPYQKFSKSIAKFVRKEHVGTSHHWMFTASEENTLLQ